MTRRPIVYQKELRGMSKAAVGPAKGLVKANLQSAFALHPACSAWPVPEAEERRDREIGGAS
jgi:hypothetical protein